MGEDSVQPTSWWVRLVKLDPAVFRGAVVAVIGLLGAVGILVSPEIPNALVTLWVAVMAVIQAVWTRPAVTPNAKVVSFLPDPARPDVVFSGNAVPSASVPNVVLAEKARTRASYP